jgi:hypothetical protein
VNAASKNGASKVDPAPVRARPPLAPAGLVAGAVATTLLGLVVVAVQAVTATVRIAAAHILRVLTRAR